MSNIIPIKSEYNFEIKNHHMKAVSDHLEDGRKITYYFDDKLISEKIVPGGDFLTDDDWIRQLVENFCDNQKGVYVDLFRNHSDRVYLTSKMFHFWIESFGIKMLINATIEKNNYHICINANDGDAVFSGTFKAMDFSEVLEKIRIFTNTLKDVSSIFSKEIDELSNDQIEKIIKWK